MINNSTYYATGGQNFVAFFKESESQEKFPSVLVSPSLRTTGSVSTHSTTNI